MSARPKKRMTRTEAKAVDIFTGIGFLIVALATVVHALSHAEPLIATAFGYFRAAEN